MDPYEPTNILLSKIKALEPENASKIMGYILIQDINERDLSRLAFGPETLLQSVILKAKTHLGLSSNTLSTPSTPSSPNPLNTIPRPNFNSNPFSQTSPRVMGDGSFPRNPSPRPWPVPPPSAASATDNGGSNSVSPKASPFLSYDNIRAGSAVLPPFSKNDGNGGGGCGNNSADFLDEYQLDDYFSFLDDSSSRNEEFMEPRSQLGGYSVSNGESHLHRRRFSESDVCCGAEDGGFGMGFRPCMYYVKGFCKNGDNCKFLHVERFGGADNVVEANGVAGGAIVGSPREMELLYLQQQQQQQEEMMRMKVAQQQRFLAHSKYMNFLLQQQNDPERMGAAAALMSDEFHKFGQFGPERNEFLAMQMAEKNSASRQIYLTFPADSTFKDEDVSQYFSTFGQVQDVRIPYQQKRMFGFVTFIHPETVKHILARGNPHYICESRVLVKPYKEKGKVANSRRQLHLQQQLLERGNFSPSSSPSGISPRELYDLHLGARMLHNMQEVMLRRKLEEQAELQQAIELQGRRLVNLQLPDLRGDYVRHHQRSVSLGSPFSPPTYAPLNQNVILSADGNNQDTAEGNVENSAAATSFAAVSAEENIQLSNNNDRENYIPEECNNHEHHGRNEDHVLPDSLFGSTKSSGDQHGEMPGDLAAATKSTEAENNVSVPTTCSDVASH